MKGSMLSNVRCFVSDILNIPFLIPDLYLSYLLPPKLSIFGGSTSSYIVCLLCTNSITDLFSLLYSATLLVTWQIYSPVSFVSAIDTLTLLSTLVSLVVVEVIVTRASAISRVPLWYHSMVGAGNPLATQNKVVMSDIATLTSEGEESIMNGATVCVEMKYVYY